MMMMTIMTIMTMRMMRMMIRVHAKKKGRKKYIKHQGTPISIFHIISRQSVSTCISQVALHPRMQLNWRPLTCTDSGSGIAIPFQLTSPKLEAVDHAMMSFPGSLDWHPHLLQPQLQDLAPAPCRPWFFHNGLVQDTCRLGNWPPRPFPPPQRRSGHRPAELLPGSGGW